MPKLIDGMHYQGEAMVCSSCGVCLMNTVRENAYYGKKPYPGDFGTGMCRKCGGYEGHPDFPADPPLDSEEAFKIYIGEAMQVFYEARFPGIRDNLRPENQKKWDEMPYWRKCFTVRKFLESGTLKW